MATRQTDEATVGARKDPVWLRWQLVVGVLIVVDPFLCIKLDPVHTKGGIPIYVLVFLAAWPLWLLSWMIPRGYGLRMLRRVVLGVSLAAPLAFFLWYVI